MTQVATKTTVDTLENFVGSEVNLVGWMQRNRPSGKIQFLVLRDGTGVCQCVIEKGKIAEELFTELKHLGQESSLSLTGRVRREARSIGGYELAVTDAQVIQRTTDYPITPKAHGVDFLMKHRHLHLRSGRLWAIGKIRHTVINAIRHFFNENGFTLIDTPILTTIAGEEVGSLFEVDYFGDPIHLAQTGQLYLESAAMSFGKVYCFGPTFRAEKSKTRRHLTEFWMVEPEVAFIDLPGLLELAERFVASIVARVLGDNRKELESLGAGIEALEKITPPFYRLTYSEAVELLTSDRTAAFMANELQHFEAQKRTLEQKIADLEAQQKGSLKHWQREKNAAELITLGADLSEVETKILNNPKHAELAGGFQWGKDLGGSDETILSLMHDKPLFVTHYPKACKAFYMKADRSDGRVVENFDCLAPAGFGEIIGGSMREEDYDLLLGRTLEEGLDPQDYGWYLDLRKYGSVPHGGFGLGVERTVAWITGEKHIRQCIPFPRMMDKVYI